MMKRSKIFCCLLTTIFLLIVFSPLQSAEAFRGSLERERVPFIPSTGDRYQTVPVGPPQNERPVVPSPDEKPALPDPTNGFGGGNMPEAMRNFRRDGGVSVPSAPSSNSSPRDNTPSPSPEFPSLPETPSWLTTDEARAFELLNEFRSANNLPLLQVHPGLVEVARLKAQDLSENDYFSHVSPTYGSISQMLRGADISYRKAAENLSKAGNVGRAHLQLEYSTQGHRQIMLNPDYTHVGIGVVSLQKVPGIILVQLYIEQW